MTELASLTQRIVLKLNLLLALGIPLMAKTVLAQPIDVWLGTGGKPSLGIYHCTLDPETGRLSESQLMAEIGSPGFLALHPKQPRLYCVGNLDGVGVVAGYRIDSAGTSKTLVYESSQPIGDGGGTHLAISKDGSILLTAQYGGGSLAAFALDEKGVITKRIALIKHEGGSGVFPGRQDAPHAHWVGFSPDQRFALVPDLGLDQVVVYRLDIANSQLHPHGFGPLPAGAGPRHMKFHPNGKWAYVINELDLTVSLFDWESVFGTLTIRQTIPTVDADQLNGLRSKSCSEIRIHPNGKTVYAANRGHDSITVFRVDDDGTLTAIQNEPVRGATPRNFNLDPTGRWLLAAGLDSHTLACFEIDPETGMLTYNSSIISTPTPICVLMQHE